MSAILRERKARRPRMSGTGVDPANSRRSRHVLARPPASRPPCPAERKPADVSGGVDREVPVSGQALAGPPRLGAGGGLPGVPGPSGSGHLAGNLRGGPPGRTRLLDLARVRAAPVGVPLRPQSELGTLPRRPLPHPRRPPRLAARRRSSRDAAGHVDPARGDPRLPDLSPPRGALLQSVLRRARGRLPLVRHDPLRGASREASDRGRRQVAEAPLPAPLQDA